MPRFASVTDRLTLTFGARYTEDERFGGKLTPRAYATYAITDSLTLACGISTGYKTCELRESAANYYSCTGGSCRRAVARPPKVATSSVSISTPPNSAANGRLARRLSPRQRETRLGAKSPTKGKASTVTSTSAVTAATMASRSARVWA